MMYTIFNVGNKEYKCRLTARACVDLEKRMGGNPMNIFMEIKKSNALPKLEDIILILHASMQSLEHGISIDDVYKIYDEYVDNGNGLMELMPVIIEIFKVSGFFKDEKENSEKNVKAGK